MQYLDADTRDLSLVRTHVRLPEDDLIRLRRLAAEKGVSVSELVRRGVKQVLQSETGPARAELWERAGKVIGKYHSGEADIGQRHDDYLPDDLFG
jgi:Arc/MetJ-type ribon-helix-helix transcriptional regulator